MISGDIDGMAIYINVSNEFTLLLDGDLVIITEHERKSCNK